MRLDTTPGAPLVMLYCQVGACGQQCHFGPIYPTSIAGETSSNDDLLGVSIPEPARSGPPRTLSPPHLEAGGSVLDRVHVPVAAVLFLEQVPPLK
jgi:hypothetical protein